MEFPGKEESEMFVDIIIKSLALFLPLLAIVLLLFAAYTDWTTRLIRNQVSLYLVFLFGIFALFTDCIDNILSHVVVSVGLLTILLPVFALGKIGGGDVKLIAASGLWMGTGNIAEFLVYMTFSGAVLALVLLSFNVRNLWEWGAVRLGLQSTDWPFRDVIGIPYGIAIAFAGTVLIFKSYVS